MTPVAGRRALAASAAVYAVYVALILVAPERSSAAGWVALACLLASPLLAGAAIFAVGRPRAHPVSSVAAAAGVAFLAFAFEFGSGFVVAAIRDSLG